MNAHAPNVLTFRPIDDLEATLVESWRDVSRVTHRFLVLLREFDLRQGWKAYGNVDCAEWLDWRCGIARVTAQVEAYCRRLRNGNVDGSVQDAKRLHESRSLMRQFREDGSGSMTVEMPRAELEVVLKALEFVGSTLPDDPTRSLVAKGADALLQMARDALAGRAGGGAASENYQVVAHVDAAAICGQGGQSDLPLPTVRRLCCDGAVVPIIHGDDGQALDVGRKQRAVPTALKRALFARDRGCTFPGVTMRATLTHTTFTIGQMAAKRALPICWCSAEPIIASSMRAAFVSSAITTDATLRPPRWSAGRGAASSGFESGREGARDVPGDSPFRGISSRRSSIRGWRPLRNMVTLLALVALVYFGLCAALFLVQRNLIYFPQPRSHGSGATTLTLPTDGAQVLVTARERSGPNALLYFGGNAEDVSYSLPSVATAFPDHALYLLHYRGYGGSSGKPSEAALFADALVLFDRAHTDHRNIVVVGRSLGSGVAIHLASLRPVARLVLVTPFDSLQDLAAQQFPFFPVRWLLLDKFESWRYAEQVTAPTLIVAAEHDEVIPRTSTEALYKRFRTGVASFEVVAGTNHNTVSESPDYVPLLQSR